MQPLLRGTLHCVTTLSSALFWVFFLFFVNTVAWCLGWVHESIGYRVRLVQDDDSSEDDSLLDFSSDCDSNFDGRRRKQLEMERTLVHQC